MELDSAFANDNLPSSTSFFQSRPLIEASEVYKFIRDLPKGGGLHLHSSAVTSIDWVISNITYRNNLYSCYKELEEILVFGWFDARPGSTVKGCHGWKAASSMREEMGAQEVDKYFKTHLSIVVDNPDVAYPNVNTVWAAFGKRFRTLSALLSFKDLVKEHFYQGLKEFYDDGAQYIEVRSSFSPICATPGPDCTPLDIVQTAKVFKEAADQVSLQIH